MHYCRSFAIIIFSLFPFHFLSSQDFYFEQVFSDSAFSFRGLSVVDDAVAWASGNGIGKTTDGGRNWSIKRVKGFEKFDFRAVYAFDSLNAIIANAGSPAYIFRTQNGGLEWMEVYRNDDSAAFIDGIDFWNDKDGIVYGDPIEGKMLVLTTVDSGFTWKNLQAPPVLFDGEASFAASGTAIRCYRENKVIIATGGNVSRLMVSENRGESWTDIKVPVIQGKSSTGIFSLLFNDDNAIIVGGDYLVDSLKKDHVFYSLNNGAGWLIPGKTTGGYRECVEFINDKLVLAVGPGGADFSNNSGKDWFPVNEKSLHVIRKARKGKLVIAAGSKKISVLHY